MDDPHLLPPNLPAPLDDGAAAHLTSAVIADLELPSTSGDAISLARLSASPTVLFFYYPRTGVPGQRPNRGIGGEDWDEIPGARGCTPQNCAATVLEWLVGRPSR